MLTHTHRLILLLAVFYCHPAAYAQPDPREQINLLIAQQKYLSAEKLLRRQINQDPANTELKFRLAQVLAWQGKYHDALSVYDEIIIHAPENTDYLLGKAQALHWSDKTEAAVLHLEKARNLDPAYQDIWKLEIQYLQLLNTRESNQQANQLLQLARKQFPLSQWPEPAAPVQATGKKSYNEIEITIAYDSLDNDYDSWTSAKLRVEHRYASERKIYASVGRSQRFSLTDTEYTLGIYTPLHSKFDASFEASYSPEHHVKPERIFYGQLQYALSTGNNLSVSVRQANYTLTSTDTYSLGIEKYLDNLRLSYTLYSTGVTGTYFDSEQHYTHLFAMDYFYGDSNKTGVRLSDGKELEYDGVSQPVITPVRSFTILGLHWLNSGWAVSYDLHYFQQGDFYHRTGLELGVRHRF